MGVNYKGNEMNNYFLQVYFRSLMVGLKQFNAINLLAKGITMYLIFRHKKFVKRNTAKS